MGQIFGNMNDPRARESARGSLSNPPAKAPVPDTTRPYTEEIVSSIELSDGPTAPALMGIGDLLRTRKEDLERRLATATRLVDLSQRRAFDLTLEELTEIWEAL